MDRCGPFWNRELLAFKRKGNELHALTIWHPRREGRPKSQNFVHILDCSPPSFIILFHHPPLLPPSGHPLTTVVTNHRNNNPFQTHVWFTYPPLIGCTTIQLRQEENGTELTNKSPPTQAGSGAATVGTHTKNKYYKLSLGSLPHQADSRRINVIQYN